MCWDKIVSIFRKKPSEIAPEPIPVLYPPLTIPFPEEAENPLQTIANTNAEVILWEWLVNYDVPQEHWEYWKTKIDIQVVERFSDLGWTLASDLDSKIPAVSWEEGGRHLAIKPTWLNPGVIAHEQAHNSYALLSTVEKREFVIVHSSVLTDPLVELLYRTKRPTWGDFDVEGHAEIYRYLGGQMPEVLKKYYPKLFSCLW